MLVVIFFCFVANAKVIIAFFMHLHIVIIRDVKNLKNITKKRKMYFFVENMSYV